jgi:TetR/AcrR family transcriptional regulator
VSEAMRAHIIDAALRVLEREGYAATSVKDIGVEAGVAPGLVHYYFKTKEDLVVAALSRACEKLLPLEIGSDPVEFVSAAFAKARLEELDSREQRACRRVIAEMMGLAVHNEAIRETLVQFLRQQRRSIDEAVRTLLANRPELPAELAFAVGWALDASMHGLSSVGLIDPEFDEAAAREALGELAVRAVGTVVEEAAAQPKTRPRAATKSTA